MFYVLSGAEDLVLVNEDSGASQYRPRTEGLFAQIVHHQETSNDYWEVRSKDGLISLYGTPGTAGHDPAVVADPVDRTKTFALETHANQTPLATASSTNMSATWVRMDRTTGTSCICSAFATSIIPPRVKPNTCCQ